MSGLNFLEKKIINTKLKEKPFSMGMYSFVMFIINYYARVKKQINSKVLKKFDPNARCLQSINC